MDKQPRIFITGATGFIGRSLICELRSRGYLDLTALVRRTSNTAFLKENNVKTVLGDISDCSSFNDLKGDYDILFHCAGFVADGEEEILCKVNILGTENICRWALKHKIKKFIYISSVAVNSGNPEIPLTEERPYSATNKYGLSKLDAEKIVVRFRNSGLPVVIIRPCMVYGEGEPHMLPLLSRLLRLRLLILPNLGRPKLHLVSVRNVAACLAHCMEDERALGGTFHIADKEVLTVGEIFEIFAKSLKVPNPIKLSPATTKFFTLIPFIGKRIKFLCKDRVYSIERLKSILNFTPPYRAHAELSNSVQSLK